MIEAKATISGYLIFDALASRPHLSIAAVPWPASRRRDRPPTPRNKIVEYNGTQPLYGQAPPLAAARRDLEVQAAAIEESRGPGAGLGIADGDLGERYFWGQLWAQLPPL